MIRRKLARWVPLFAMAALLAGCTDGGVVGVGTLDSGGTADPGVEDPGTIAPDAVEGDASDRDPGGQTGDVPEGSLVSPPFVPAMSLRFEEAGREGDAWLIDVVARDFPEVFGMALRVEFDAGTLAFLDAEMSPVFGEEGFGAIYRFAEVRPGSVTLASSHLSFLGEQALAGDQVIATLRVRPLAGTPTELSFFAPRSMVLTRRLESLPATFLDATLHP